MRRGKTLQRVLQGEKRIQFEKGLCLPLQDRDRNADRGVLGITFDTGSYQ